MSAWHPQSPRAQRPGPESVWTYRRTVSERREALRHLLRPSPPEPRWTWWRRLMTVTGGAR